MQTLFPNTRTSPNKNEFQVCKKTRSYIDAQYCRFLHFDEQSTQELVEKIRVTSVADVHNIIYFR